MLMSSEDLLKRIHETKAVSIWDHKKGPIFWYAAAIPGPFYVNTELVIGPDLSKKLLAGISAIVAETTTSGEKAKKLEALIMAGMEGDESFQSVIDSLAAHMEKAFPKDSYNVISGGERRDWIFSIPLAKKLGLPHIYLFKNGESYCETEIPAGSKSIHVADLINNGVSYFDNWFPILNKAGITCKKTICVNVRGENGLNRLKEAGVQVEALNYVDVPFFEKSLQSGLIDEDTLEELKLFFQSAQEWASKYVMGHPHLFNVPALDDKSFARMQSFFANDPWGLKEAHQTFFEEMQKAIADRLSK